MRISPPARASARHQGPIIKVQDDGGIVILTGFIWEILAWPVLGGNQAQPQGADVYAVRQLQPLDHFRPGEHGVSGEYWRDVPAAIDAGDVESVAEPVERQRAGERNHVPAIDQAAAEPALTLGELVEVDLGRILVQSCRDLVLGLLYRHAVHVIDPLAGRVVAKALRAA